MSFEIFKTGFYVRIQRDERYESVDIAAMSEDELNDFVSKMDATTAQKWVRGLVKWIQENVQFEAAEAS